MNNKGCIAIISASAAIVLISCSILNIGKISHNSPTKVILYESTKSTSNENDISLPNTNESNSPEEEFIRININTADKDELMKLNGIGESLAEAIIEYRSSNGNFKNIEEIMKVNGIGSGIFSEISCHIFVDDPEYEEVSDPTTESVYTDKPTTPTEIDTTKSEKNPDDDVPINLNTATLDELMLLPYVTEDIALKIIELREQIGGYSHVYELLLIGELSQQQVEEILEYVYIDVPGSGYP